MTRKERFIEVLSSKIDCMSDSNAIDRTKVHIEKVRMMTDVQFDMHEREMRVVIKKYANNPKVLHTKLRELAS